MDEFTIKLTDAVRSLKELYFTEGKGSIFTYKATKWLLRIVFAFAILTPLFYLFSLSNQITWVVLFVFAVFGLSMSLLAFCIRADKYFKWKNGVTNYLKEVAKFDSHLLKLSSQTFELINGGETIIEKWSNFKKVTISSSHMVLSSESKSQYTFPAKSMKPAEYEALKEFIRQKINETVEVK